MTEPAAPTPWYVYPVLLAPRRIARSLDAVRASGRFERVPNLWQLSQGVIRTWHRILFRSETVGLCVSHPPRPNWRARLFQFRPLRGPFLLAAGAVAPLDLTGLASRPERTIRHLLGTHHDGKQFAYDLEILACHPGRLTELRGAVEALLATDDRESRWLADLAVYQTYHPRLLAAVTAAEQGDLGLDARERRDPDISFAGYLAWCAAQPETLGETLALWRRGAYRWSVGRA